MRKKSLYSFNFVKSKFIKYLDDNKLRKTMDRFAILEQTYQFNGHFDIDMLYNKMKSGRFRVSRPTLYNTLALLIDCGFVLKYQFPNKDIKYEFVFHKDTVSHYHIYNLDNNEVIEFSDNRVDKIIKDVEKKYNLEIENCNIILYGRSKDEPEE